MISRKLIEECRDRFVKVFICEGYFGSFIWCVFISLIFGFVCFNKVWKGKEDWKDKDFDELGQIGKFRTKIVKNFFYRVHLCKLLWREQICIMVSIIRVDRVMGFGTEIKKFKKLVYWLIGSYSVWGHFGQFSIYSVYRRARKIKKKLLGQGQFLKSCNWDVGQLRSRWVFRRWLQISFFMIWGHYGLFWHIEIGWIVFTFWLHMGSFWRMLFKLICYGIIKEVPFLLFCSNCGLVGTNSV